MSSNSSDLPSRKSWSSSSLQISPPQQYAPPPPQLARAQMNAYHYDGFPTAINSFYQVGSCPLPPPPPLYQAQEMHYSVPAINTVVVPVEQALSPHLGSYSDDLSSSDGTSSSLSLSAGASSSSSTSISLAGSAGSSSKKRPFVADLVGLTTPSISVPIIGEDPSVRLRAIVNEFLKVVNLGDASAMKSKVITYCSSDVDVTIRYQRNEPCPYSQCAYLAVLGVHAVSVFFESSLVAIPDTRMTLQEVKTRMLSKGIMTITYRYALAGTKTLSLACDRSNSLIINNPASSSTSSGDKIMIYPIEGENRNSLILENLALPPLNRMIVGSVDPPVRLKLYGSLQVTYQPLSGEIDKIVITHNLKKR